MSFKFGLKGLDRCQTVWGYLCWLIITLHGNWGGGGACWTPDLSICKILAMALLGGCNVIWKWKAVKVVSLAANLTQWPTTVLQHKKSHFPIKHHYKWDIFKTVYRAPQTANTVSHYSLYYDGVILSHSVEKLFLGVWCLLTIKLWVGRWAQGKKRAWWPTFIGMNGCHLITHHTW